MRDVRLDAQLDEALARIGRRPLWQLLCYMLDAWRWWSR